MGEKLYAYAVTQKQRVGRVLKAVLSRNNQDTVRAHGLSEDEIKDSWRADDVARQQNALVQKELRQPMSVAPFKTFIDVINSVLENHDDGNIKFLDVGCGVGHYSELLHRYFPGKFTYAGSDYSEHMIKMALEHRSHENSQFIVDDIFSSKVDFSKFDIVMASALVDVIKDFWDVLDIFFRQRPKLLILHRQRLTDKPSYSEMAPGYSGQMTYATFLNVRELQDCLAKYALQIKQEFVVSDNIRSFLIEPVDNCSRGADERAL